MQIRSIAAAVALSWLGLMPAESVVPLSAAAAAVCDARTKPAKLNLTLKDHAGRKVTLADFKGKVIVLNFWATWCAPCKVEIPALVELQTRYGGDLQVVGVSVDDPPDTLRPFIDAFKVNYPVLQGRGHDEVLEAYAPVPAIPATIVIGRDGNICARHSGAAARDTLERQIQALR